MYSLPIATYTDYWRSAKSRSLTVGSTLLLAGSALVYAPADKILERPLLNLVGEIQSFVAPVGSDIPDVFEESLSTEATLTLDSDVNTEPVLPGLSGNVAVTYRIEDVVIPVTTEYIETDKLAPGMSEVREQGEKGVERRVIRTTYVGGEMNDEQIIHQFSKDAPKKRVVIQNTKPVKIEAFDMSQLNVKKTFTVEATAYTHTGNPTATGVYPREGLIAVDPRVIPLGTKVYVEGYGYAIAADTGGAIKGNIIDVFFPSLQRCLDWGRRPVTIHIIDGK